MGGVHVRMGCGLGYGWIANMVEEGLDRVVMVW